MPDSARLTSSQLRRAAIVYVRQSSPSQLERNTESTQRQYALVTQAVGVSENVLIYPTVVSEEVVEQKLANFSEQRATVQ